MTGWSGRLISLSAKGQFIVRIRTILILVLSLSVAMLPARAGILMLNDGSVQSSDALALTSHGDDHDGTLADQTMKDCQAAAGCASKCFSLYNDMSASPMTYPPVILAEPTLASRTLPCQIGDPPFRPPRV